jgi:hypothetical protein
LASSSATCHDLDELLEAELAVAIGVEALENGAARLELRGFDEMLEESLELSALNGVRIVLVELGKRRGQLVLLVVFFLLHCFHHVDKLAKRQFVHALKFLHQRASCRTVGRNGN